MLYQTTCSTLITVRGVRDPQLLGGGAELVMHSSHDKNYVAIHTKMCFTRQRTLRKLQLDLNQY